MATSDLLAFTAIVVSVITLCVNVLNSRRADNLDAFLKFTERYEAVSGPLKMSLGQLQSEGSSSDLLPTLRSYLNLCSEEFFYSQQHYIPKKVWNIWQKEIERNLKKEQIQKIWLATGGLRTEFDSYTEFREWVDSLYTTGRS